MRANKPSNPELRLISIGLLLVIVPFLMNDWVHVPDFIRGALMGIGIGLEIIGLVRMTRRRKTGTVQCK